MVICTTERPLHTSHITYLMHTGKGENFKTLLVITNRDSSVDSFFSRAVGVLEKFIMYLGKCFDDPNFLLIN